MKLSTKSEYALLALLCCLDAYREERRIKIEEISQKRSIPKKYLEQILTSLKQAGIISTKRGAGGGISLAKPPEEISLASVIRLMDGALAPTRSVSTYFYEPTPLEQSEVFVSLFKEIRDYLAEKLEHTSLADLA